MRLGGARCGRECRTAARRRERRTAPRSYAARSHAGATTTQPPCCGAVAYAAVSRRAVRSAPGGDASRRHAAHHSSALPPARRRGRGHSVAGVRLRPGAFCIAPPHADGAGAAQRERSESAGAAQRERKRRSAARGLVQRAVGMGRGERHLRAQGGQLRQAALLGRRTPRPWTADAKLRQVWRLWRRPWPRAQVLAARHAWFCAGRKWLYTAMPRDVPFVRCAFYIVVVIIVRARAAR